MNIKVLLATAALIAGAGVGAFLFAPTLATAQDTDADTQAEVDKAPADDAAPSDRARSHLADVLQGLVDDGVIDEAQADAVEEAIVAARPEGRFAPRHRRGAVPRLGAAAEILGIEQAALFEAIRDGQTLAEVAEANGVDPQTLIDSLITQAEMRIDEQVEAGRLLPEQAEEMKVLAGERIDGLVTGELDRNAFPGRRGPARPFPGEGRFGPPGLDDPAGA